jgi:hypothetical protein
LEEKNNQVAKLMPELLSSANLIDKKPVIRYFEGREGMKEVYNDTLNYPGQTLLSWFPDDVYWLGNDFFIKEYIPKRLNKKISAKAIAPNSDFNLDFFKKNQEHLRQMKFIPHALYKSKIEIIIYGTNKVGILSYLEELGIIIESDKIHEALKSIFEVMWKQLPDKAPEQIDPTFSPSSPL